MDGYRMISLITYPSYCLSARLIALAHHYHASSRLPWLHCTYVFTPINALVCAPQTKSWLFFISFVLIERTCTSWLVYQCTSILPLRLYSILHYSYCFRFILISFLSTGYYLPKVNDYIVYCCYFVDTFLLWGWFVVHIVFLWIITNKRLQLIREAIWNWPEKRSEKYAP